MLYYFRTFFLFLLCWLCIAGGFTWALSYAPEAENGVLYLTQEQIQDEIIDLKGKWEFYWNAFYLPQNFQTNNPPAPDGLIQVPGIWNDFQLNGVQLPGQGYATYRLRVLLEDTVSSLALRIKTVSTAAALYVNGKKVYQAGQPSVEAFGAQPDYRPKIIRLPADTYHALELVLQVSNFHYRKAGLWNPIYLGKEETLRQSRDQILYHDYFLLGSIMMIGLYHLVLFLLRKQDPSPFYFGLFCMFVVLRILTTNEYAIQTFWPTVSWSVVIRLEYLSFILGVPAFTAFVRYVFKEEFSRIALQISIVAALIAASLTLLTPPTLFTYIPPPYQLLTVGLSLYAYYVVYKSWRNGKDKVEAVVFLLGFTVLFVAIINDSLYTNEIIETTLRFSDGLFVFIFAQSFLIAMRSSRSFLKAERLSYKLHLTNNTLEKRVSDRTESLQKANEDLLQKNRQIAEQNKVLTKLNSELDHFVYSVSHDLRAPVTSALGLIEVARLEQDPDQVNNYLDLQEKSLRKLDQFIRDILDYSRNARTVFQPKPLCLDHIIKQSKETYAYLPNFDRIHWTIDVDEADTFISDERRLSIIINNLVSNAIRYADFRKGKPVVQIKVHTHKGKIRLVIRDNGIGISTCHLPHIFDMFYRAHTDAKGSGLGLFIVREAVEKLQGSIRVFSREREGTTFVILLPSLHLSLVADRLLV